MAPAIKLWTRLRREIHFCHLDIEIWHTANIGYYCKLQMYQSIQNIIPSQQASAYRLHNSWKQCFNECYSKVEENREIPKSLDIGDNSNNRRTIQIRTTLQLKKLRWCPEKQYSGVTGTNKTSPRSLTCDDHDHSACHMKISKKTLLRPFNFVDRPLQTQTHPKS